MARVIQTKIGGRCTDCFSACKGGCRGGCYGCNSCVITCAPGCHYGCGGCDITACKGSCTGSCGGGCKNGCGGSCTGGCGGCDTGCSSCVGGCLGGCGGQCKENCLGACKNNCDKQCQNGNYSDINNINIKYNEWLKAEDINIIINTIKYEVARRKITNKDYSVMIGERIDDSKINEIIKNLKLLGYNYQDINYGEKSNHSLIQKIIEDTKTSYNKTVDSHTGKES